MIASSRLFVAALAWLCTQSAVAQPSHAGGSGREQNTDVPGSARAQGDDTPAADLEREEVVARDSPRAALADFLARCRSGDFEAAAAYLELTTDDEPFGAVLARRLKAVLDRELWIEPEVLSPLPSGNPQDGLPPYTDELGRIDGPEGVPEPVRIVRRKREGARWMFSNATVQRIDGWYARLPDRWMLEHLPAPLLRVGPRALMWWQWLALPALVALSWASALALSRLTAKLVAKLAARSSRRWDDALLERTRRPLTLWWTLAVAYLLLPWLALYAPAEEFVHRVMRAVFLVGFFWVLAGMIDIAAQLVFRSPWASNREASRSLISLAARVTKIAVLAIAAVALLSQVGYPVASIIAGLGVGGLAVALAAQKTVENLFGAFSIGADQLFREGDLVRVDDFVGTVELIGLRSTKFRTVDRTLISIPNGKLAEMKLETLAVRDRLRFAAVIGLARSSNAEQVQAVIDGFERLLKAQPKLWPSSASVHLEKFGPSSLDLEVSAFFDTRDWNEFQVIRQQLLLQFMTVIERSGTSLALPTSLVRVASEAPPPREPP